MLLWTEAPLHRSGSAPAEGASSACRHLHEDYKLLASAMVMPFHVHTVLTLEVHGHSASSALDVEADISVYRNFGGSGRPTLWLKWSVVRSLTGGCLA